jgi:ribonuclease G
MFFFQKYSQNATEEEENLTEDERGFSLKIGGGGVKVRYSGEGRRGKGRGGERRGGEGRTGEGRGGAGRGRRGKVGRQNRMSRKGMEFRWSEMYLIYEKPNL